MDSANILPPASVDGNSDPKIQLQGSTIYTKTVDVNNWRHATFLERFVAFVLDYIFVLPIYLLITPILTLINFPLQNRFLHIVTFCVYNIISLSLYGTTIGKRLMKLKVISENDQPLTIGQISIRETIGKFLSSILIGIGYTAMIFHPRKQTWHDRMCHTLVVKYPKQSIKKMALFLIVLFPIVLVLSLYISIIFLPVITD